MTELITENRQDAEIISDELLADIKNVCETVMELEDCDFDAQISLSFVTDSEIRRINKENRDIDAVTDVLSFPMLEFDEDGCAVLDDCDYAPDTDIVILGDIVIAPQRARTQAEEYGHSIRREICFLCAHSMLHLLGYDHVDDEEGERIMNEKQEKALSLLGITRDE